MHEKRYQVFISSTFEDLKEERRAVQDVLINTGDFPVQMESFPAADEDQFEFIKSLIDQCDYYILIIAGRYGTVADDGLSYTHKEFRYAISKEVPVLVMVHEDLTQIVVGKSEDSQSGKKRLQDFIKEAEQGRLRRTWSTGDGLKLAVREALDNAKSTKPRIGWVRGNSAANVETLNELNQVRKENEKYRNLIELLEDDFPLPQIPLSTDPVDIQILPETPNSGYDVVKIGSRCKIRTTWISIFPIFQANFKYEVNDWEGTYEYYPNKEQSCIAIGSAIAGEISQFETTGFFKISEGNFDRLLNYYIEVGLMLHKGEVPFAEMAQKLARRHSINGMLAADFQILDGEIKVENQGYKQSNLDKEIPF